MSAKLFEYKCPCCGGAIAFDADIQKLKCPYCDTTFEMESLRQYDEDLKSDSADDLKWNTKDKQKDQWDNVDENGLCSFVCKSCGGEIIGDANTAATSCPFCGNPVVMSGRVAGSLKPDYVIPFKLDKEAAKAGLEKHLLGKKLLPDVFKSKNHIDEIKGIYVPFWMFDADANADVRFRATKLHSWSDRNYNYTETEHYSVQRGGSLSFENVPADGSSKLDDTLMESIEPFDFSEAVDFQTAYLAGYLADKYDVPAENCIDRVNERVKRSTEAAFANTVVGYSSVMPENSSVRLKQSNLKYAFLPVWILNTTWNGNKYVFAMNGQTGKFVGDLPIDKSKKNKYFWMYTGIGAAVTFAIAALINLL